MNGARAYCRAIALAACVALTGCAPAVFSPPALNLGVGIGRGAPSLQIAPSTCMLQGTSVPTTSANAASAVRAQMDHMSYVFAKHIVSSASLQTKMSLWKRLATGGC